MNPLGRRRLPRPPRSGPRHFGHIRDKTIPIAGGDRYVETLDDILREHACVIGRCVATVRLLVALLRIPRPG